MSPDSSQQAVPDVGAASPCLQDVLLRHTPSGAEGASLVSCWCGERFDTFAHHAAHQAAVWGEVCMVRTVEQLDALPVGAVVVCAGRPGEIWTERIGAGSWQKDDDDRRQWFWWGMDFGEPASEVPLPALLVWSPDWSES